MKNNKGFAIFGAIIVIAIVGAVVASGFVVFDDLRNRVIEVEDQVEWQDGVLERQEDILEEQDERLGAFRPSNYVGKLLTRLNEGGAESSFNTTPAAAADDSTLTNAKLGDFIVFTINPGADNEEKISVSAVSTSGTTATWTIINRGLSFTENVQITANIKQHAIGEAVIISNDDHYLSQQYLATDDDNQTIGGLVVFTDPPIFTNVATSSDQGTTKGYVDTTAFRGAPAASTSTPGIGVVAEGVHMASSSPPGSQGTTTPQFLTTINSSADPTLIRESDPNATSTNYTVVTESDLYINQGFFDLDTEDWLFDSDADGRGRIGVGTSTKSAHMDLELGGNALIGGTTTMSNLIATGTAIQLGGIDYSVPLAQATANGQVLTNNGSGALSWTLSGSMVSFIPQPMYATSTVETSLNSNTTMKVVLVNFPGTITVNKISVEAYKNSNTPGTFDICVYSEDGQTKLIDQVTGTITSGGVETTTITETTLIAGNYYMAAVPNSTANLQLTSWKLTGVSVLMTGVSGEPDYSGSVTVSAGACPTTITPASLTDSVNDAVVFRFDN